MRPWKEGGEGRLWSGGLHCIPAVNLEQVTYLCTCVVTCEVSITITSKGYEA